MSKVFIIAEAGVNHNGSIAIAKKLIDQAAEAGVDAIKFQTFITKNVISKYASKAIYQRKHTPKNESQFDMIKKLELDKNAHIELIERCKDKGVLFLSAPFDLESIDLLNALNLKIIKIPSGEITNLPYLRKIGSLRRKIIMSTGMATLKEVKVALDILIENGTKKKDIVILHCNTEYPTPFSDVNLLAMHAIKNKFRVQVGYSDHTPGIEAAIAAVALGARVIEKHFTLDKKMPGPDHQASLEPDELKRMVNAVRNVEMALGSGVKEASSSEKINKDVVRKSIVAAVDIKRGERFTEKNLAIKRPGTGINPMRWDVVLGKVAKKDFYQDELIKI